MWEQDEKAPPGLCFLDIAELQGNLCEERQDFLANLGPGRSECLLYFGPQVVGKQSLFGIQPIKPDTPSKYFHIDYNKMTCLQSMKAAIS